MALRMGLLYDALLLAHVPEDKARQAAEEVAGFERDMVALRSDLRLLTWMVGTLMAVATAILFKVW